MVNRNLTSRSPLMPLRAFRHVLVIRLGLICVGVVTWAHIAAKYMEEEWGFETHGDSKLFEMLTLEGAQAGLSWATILKKRENYRWARRAPWAIDPAASASQSPHESWSDGSLGRH